MITITETAEQHVLDLIKTNADKKSITPDNLFLRIYIAGAGPSGLNHGMALTTEKREDDLVIDRGEFKILVDKMSEQYLNGAEVDFVSHELGSNFKIINPNQIAAAGCGGCSGDAGCC